MLSTLQASRIDKNVSKMADTMPYFLANSQIVENTEFITLHKNDLLSLVQT